MARVSDRAYQAIRTAILVGTFRGGSRLREELLAEQIGVSRTPVREALRRLDADGLVQLLPNRGARVVAWSDNHISEIFALRALVEGYAASRAAEAFSEDQTDELFALCDRMEALVQQRGRDALDDIAPLNNTFHRLIATSSGGRHLPAQFDQLIQMPLVFRTFRYYSDEELARSMAHHRELAVAIRNQDAEWATCVMRSHIYAARSAVSRKLPEEGVAEMGG